MLSDKVAHFLKQHPEFERLQDLFRDLMPCWLVGGCLRDLLLERPINDVDIACAGDPTAVARRWSRQVGGRWFWLDKERRQSRALLPTGITVDFAPLRAETIATDQTLRDFTINSLAFPLQQPLCAQQVLDPLNGIQHLVERRLVPCSTRSFSDDPLRMLKGIRHAVTLKLAVDPETKRQLLQHQDLIHKVAGERCQEELGKILAAEDIGTAVQLLLESGLLAALCGEPGGQIDQGELSADMEALGQAIDQFNEQVRALGGEEQVCIRRIDQLLAQLLRVYQPNNLPRLLHDRLRFSRERQQLIQQLQEPPAAELLTLAESVSTPRQQALVFEALRPFAEQKLFFQGWQQQRFAPQRLITLSQAFSSLQQFNRIPPLLSAKEMSQLLNNAKGRILGQLEKMLKHAEMTGEINSPEEAKSWLKKQNI